ncbi:CAP domain-containing protein [Flavobacterium humi]|uniref:CAP domain-containing protein n=1 Tax=Flavobacterium humi TaxID=2562683 RepID=A0A4Z0LD84_9FLAO|nr:CAP domain-containing protein [Flavobacterium humi]TGD59837.1 CAP domain-containing protein [Flavobacterium humi]
MKKILAKVVFLVLISTSFISCSGGSDEETVVRDPKLDAKYSYISEEEQVMKLINDHRASIGLNRLQVVDYISFVSEEHDNYMISTGTISHNFFQDRYEKIVEGLGAKTVGENLACNYSSAESVVNAWLNSESHKVNLEGDYTHFGISIRANAEGKKYYTNIFMKK